VSGEVNRHDSAGDIGAPFPETSRAASRCRVLAGSCDYGDAHRGVERLSGTKNQCVIIQAKHWRSKSIRPIDVSDALTQMAFWEPPSYGPPRPAQPSGR
jgi:hypothetical protein